MKVQKTELAAKLNKIKGVVPKKTTMPILQGILVNEGYLIANNMEMTVKAKLEGTEDECFIIPERAFDLINNLPDGEVDISVTAENTITIKADKLKQKKRQDFTLPLIICLCKNNFFPHNLPRTSPYVIRSSSPF